jgi:uncharacterized glyoxalase superfamily protein PhnB
MGMTKQELIQEYIKCHGDTSYALKTYLQTYDNTQQKHVPFELFPEQKEMIKDFENHILSILPNYTIIISVSCFNTIL